MAPSVEGEESLRKHIKYADGKNRWKSVSWLLGREVPGREANLKDDISDNTLREIRDLEIDCFRLRRYECQAVPGHAHSSARHARGTPVFCCRSSFEY